MRLQLLCDTGQQALQGLVLPGQRIHLYPFQVGTDLFGKRSSGTLYGQMEKIDVKGEHKPREPVLRHNLVKPSGRYRESAIVFDPVFFQVNAEIPASLGDPDNLVVGLSDRGIPQTMLEICRIYRGEVEKIIHLIEESFHQFLFYTAKVPQLKHCGS